MQLIVTRLKQTQSSTLLDVCALSSMASALAIMVVHLVG
jgi:hypothetical protein